MSLTLPPISLGKKAFPQSLGLLRLSGGESGESVQPRGALCSAHLSCSSSRANSKTQELWRQREVRRFPMERGGPWLVPRGRAARSTSPVAGLTATRKPKGAHKEQHLIHPLRNHLRVSERAGWVHMGTGPPLAAAAYVCGCLRDFEAWTQ